MLFMISLSAMILGSSGEAWAQKSLPTVRISIEAVAGTNSHYYVTKQLGLFQKHGLNLELISFPGGTVGIQSLLAGDLIRNCRREPGPDGKPPWGEFVFLAGITNTFPFSILSKPDVRTRQDLRGKKIVISR